MDGRAVQMPFVSDGNFNQGSGSILACARATGPASRETEEEHNSRACDCTEKNFQELKGHRATLILQSAGGAFAELRLLGFGLGGELGNKLVGLKGGTILLIKIHHHTLEFGRSEDFDPIDGGFELAHLGLALGGDLLFGHNDQAIARG